MVFWLLPKQQLGCCWEAIQATGIAASRLRLEHHRHHHYGYHHHRRHVVIVIIVVIVIVKTVIINKIFIAITRIGREAIQAAASRLLLDHHHPHLGYLGYLDHYRHHCHHHNRCHLCHESHLCHHCHPILQPHCLEIFVVVIDDDCLRLDDEDDDIENGKRMKSKLEKTQKATCVLVQQSAACWVTSKSKS